MINAKTTSKVFIKNYEKYRTQFKQLRKQGLVKANQRLLKKSDFMELSKDVGSYSKAVKEALKYQNKLGEFSKGDINKLWKQYKKNNYSVDQMMGTSWQGNDVELAKGVTTKFRTKETMLKGLKANQLIQLMIDAGLSQEEALEEYGY